MGIAAILFAQTVDPVRVVLVLLSLWVVSKLYDKGQRLVPSFVAMALSAVLATFALAAMQAPRPMDEWAAMTVTGFVACCLLWAVTAAATGAYQRLRA